MFGFLINLLGGKLNFTLYAVAAIALAGVGWQVASYISDHEKNKVIIAQLEKDISILESAIANKDAIINIQKKNIENINTVIDERDKKLEELENKVVELTNLGDDANDEAAESLKELIRRLKESRASESGGGEPQ